MSHASLFDSALPIWLDSPEIAFDGWVTGLPLKRNSMQVSRYMWGKFCRWLTAHSLRLDHIDASHIATFLSDERVTKQQRYRYVRLVERVFLHLSALPGYPMLALNPGSDAARNRIATARNDPTVFLTVSERAALTEVIKGKKEEKNDKSRAGERGGPTGEWRAMRDRALLGVFAGGGLKVHEAEYLTVSCISPEGVVKVPERWPFGGKDSVEGAKPNCRPHSVPLEPYAWEAMQKWLGLRRQQTVGDALFPSTVKGAPMHRSSMFRRVRHLLDVAGVRSETDDRACCQTLRNSFAATLFDRDIDSGTIAEYLGYAEPLTVERLRFAYDVWSLSQVEDDEEASLEELFPEADDLAQE